MLTNRIDLEIRDRMAGHPVSFRTLRRRSGWAPWEIVLVWRVMQSERFLAPLEMTTLDSVAWRITTFSRWATHSSYST